MPAARETSGHPAAVRPGSGQQGLRARCRLARNRSAARCWPQPPGPPAVAAGIPHHAVHAVRVPAHRPRPCTSPSAFMRGAALSFVVRLWAQHSSRSRYSRQQAATRVHTASTHVRGAGVERHTVAVALLHSNAPIPEGGTAGSMEGAAGQGRTAALRASYRACWPSRHSREGSAQGSQPCLVAGTP